MPTIAVARSDIEAGYGVQDAFVAAGLAASKSEVRRHIKAGAAKLNGETVTDENATVGTSDLDSEGSARLSVGKKRHARLIIG